MTGKRRIGEGGEAAAREVPGSASCSLFYSRQRAGPVEADPLGGGSAGRLSVVGIAGGRATRRREEEAMATTATTTATTTEWTDSPDRVSVPALRDARSATQGQRQGVMHRGDWIGMRAPLLRHALVYRHRGGYLVRVGFECSKEGGSVGKSVNRRAHCVVWPTRCPLTSTQILTETNSPVEQCTELLCIDCSYAKSFVSARSIAFTHRYCNTIYMCVCVCGGKGGTKEAALRRVVEKSKGKDVDNSLVTLPKRLETDPIRMESERQKGLRNIGALEMEK